MSTPLIDGMPTVFTSTLMGYAPHALSLEETRVVTPYATVDFTSTGPLAVTVQTLGTTFTTFIGAAWPYLLGLILLILFIILAVRIGTGSFRKLGGMGRRA